MSDALINALLSSDEVFIPFDEFGGNKEVSMIVVRHGDEYNGYDFVVYDEFVPGIVDVLDSDAESIALENLIQSKSSCYKCADIYSVEIKKSYFIRDDGPVSSVKEIGIWLKSGKYIELVQEKSAYPFGFALVV